jgi:hypothetical protein
MPLNTLGLAWSSTTTPEGAALYEWAENYKPAGYNSFVMHGNNLGGFSDGSGRSTEGYYLGCMFQNNPRYDRSLPTILVACMSASTKSPTNFTGGQDFANGVNNNDPKCPVWAADTIITTSPIRGNPPTKEDGSPVHWIPFFPKIKSTRCAEYLRLFERR